MAMLAIKGLSRSFGGLMALDQVDLEVSQGQIHGLIGPNGAGKTTLFNVVTGFLRPSAGTIRLHGQDITHCGPAQITRLGVGRTFQNIRLFPQMTVLENVLVGQHCRAPGGLLRAFPNRTRREKALREEAEELLALVGLEAFLDRPASSLPFGAQRLLELARALATRPRLLLLDEPGAGMSREETDRMCGYILGIRDLGVTVLLIEHDMNMVMRLSDRVTVLNFGRKIAEGSPAEIRDNESVREAYLGSSRLQC
jgi:branched-chain amino acid transport system ATP-binding protein